MASNVQRYSTRVERVEASQSPPPPPPPPLTSAFFPDAPVMPPSATRGRDAVYTTSPATTLQQTLWAAGHSTVRADSPASGYTQPPSWRASAMTSSALRFPAVRSVLWYAGKCLHCTHSLVSHCAKHQNVTQLVVVCPRVLQGSHSNGSTSDVCMEWKPHSVGDAPSCSARYTQTHHGQ